MKDAFNPRTPQAFPRIPAKRKGKPQTSVIFSLGGICWGGAPPRLICHQSLLIFQLFQSAFIAFCFPWFQISPSALGGSLVAQTTLYLGKFKFKLFY
jgi:hypothetical protein